MSKSESETTLEANTPIIHGTIPVVVHQRGDVVWPTICVHGVSSGDGSDFEIHEAYLDSFGELEITRSFEDPTEFPATAIVEIHIKELTPGWDRAR